jgi:TetR/AcrR family transcriptional regulator, transcriptional repressor for nem operon
LTDQLRSSHSDTRDRIVEAARGLFAEHGYEFTTLAQIRKLARVNSGSLHYFFPSKEHLLIAVLEKHQSLLGPQILQPAYQQANDPIERLFAILDGFRKRLRDTDFRVGCSVGSLTLEVSNNHPKVLRLIVENFEAMNCAIENLLKEASDHLPPKTKPVPLARHVLATMEGGVMLARALRSLEPFDQAVNHLKDYFDRLLRDRAESESEPVGSNGKAREKSN